MNDPYPSNLSVLDDLAPASLDGPPDPMVVALNRIATAIEANTQAILYGRPVTIQNGQQRPANLAPLPPVQVVADKPACPFHGTEKVRTSEKGPGFFCSAKAQPGQPANPRGYCTWHS